jgi:hypothetical protein
MSLLSNSVTARAYWDFDPRSIPECDIWFDASDTSTLGLTGNVVNTWANKGSISMNAVAASGTVTSGNTENGLNYLTFPASSQMNFTCAIVNQARTWFIVARGETQLNTIGGASPTVWGPLNNVSGVSGTNRIIFERNGNVTYTATLSYHTTTVRLQTTTAPNPFETMMVISVVNSTSSTSLNGIFINGTPYTLTTNLNAASFQEGSVTYSINTASAASASDICEIIHYGRDLTGPDRKLVEYYLMNKWGINRGNDAQFNPATSLTNTCLVWYDADVDFNDATSRATSFTFSTGVNISTWIDKSGNGRNATFASSGIITTRPTLIQNAVGPKCAVNFAGNGALSNTLSLATNQSHTLFVVTAPNNTTASFQGVLTINGVSGTRSNMLTVYKSSTNLWWYSGSTGATDGNIASVTVATGRYDILAFYWSPTPQTQMNINGQYLTAANNSPSSLTANGRMALGATTNGGYAEAFNGRIAEVILYDGILTINQRNRVERYLSLKWNRPIINGISIFHPYTKYAGFSRPFFPTEIANCQLWLDGADDSTFTFSSGNNISTWLDKSGNNRTATATGTITNLGSINGRSCTNWTQTTNVAGGGVATYFRGLNNISLTGTSMTVFAVFQMNSTSQQNSRVLSLGLNGTVDSANNNYAAPLLRLTNTNFQGFRNGSRSTTTFSTVADIPVVATSQFDGTNHTLYVNGTGYTPVASTGSFNITTYVIGNSMAEFNSVWFNGFIGEVLIFNTSLNLADRQRIEGYLADKWGLRSSFSSSHFFTLARQAIPNAPLINPLSFLDLALWLDATDPDADGILPASGTAVATWYDKSGNNRHATQATASARPIFTYDGVYPAIQFTAVSGQTLGGPPVMLSLNYGIFVVSRSTAGLYRPAFYVNKGSGDRIYIMTGRSGQTYNYIIRYDLLIVDGTTKQQSGIIDNNNPIMMVISDNSGTPSNTNEVFYTNGRLETPISGTTAGGTNVATDDFGYRLGSETWFIDGSNRFLTGFIYEVIVILHLPTRLERQMIEGYLARKWGLLSSLPDSHMFKRIQP